MMYGVCRRLAIKSGAILGPRHQHAVRGSTACRPDDRV